MQDGLRCRSEASLRRFEGGMRSEQRVTKVSLGCCIDLKRVAAEPAAKRAHLRWLSSAHPFCAEGRLGVQASPAACEPDPSVRPAAALDVNATSGKR